MAQKKSTAEQIKNARRWQRHLQTWRESGQTQVEYCRVNNLGVKAFGYWLRKDRKINNPAPLQLIPVTFNTQPAANLVEKVLPGCISIFRIGPGSKFPGISTGNLFSDNFGSEQHMIFTGNIKVYIALGDVDMRKAIDGLSAMVSGVMRLDVFAGHLFAFSNRRRSMIKILYWDKNGFCLWQKRLEKGRFRWPSSREEVLQVGQRELAWLLEGLEINQASAHKQLVISHAY